MKTLMAMAVATLSLTAVGTASAQSGAMMDGSSGGWMGGYGGFWGPILLAVVVGLVVWIGMQKRRRTGFEDPHGAASWARRWRPVDAAENVSGGRQH